MALGRGLSALIPTRDSAANIRNQAETSSLASGAQAMVLQLPVTVIVENPQQPRRHFSHQALEELIQSVKQHGILQPILVSQSVEDKAAGRYELIAGERRLRATRIAGLKTIPAIVRSVDDLEKLELALIENIQRSDLNPIEKADGYRKLVNEFGLNHEEAAKKVGISRSTFTNLLRLLELPSEMQKALADGKISEGHAKVLLGVEPASARQVLFNKILSEKLSVRGIEQAVGGRTKQPKKGKTYTLPTHVKEWQDNLQLALGTKVLITPKQITIDYYSFEELGRLVKRLKQ